MAKTRAVIRVDGVERQLFSVTEAPDGHLTIAVSSLHQQLMGSVDAIKEFKVSVHNSDNAVIPKRSIHTTIRSKGGRTREFHGHFSIEEGLPLCVPFIAMVSPDFKASNHKLKAHKLDKLVQVIAFRSFAANFIAFPFVVDRGYVPPRPQGFSLNMLDFERYSIALYSTFYQQATFDGIFARLFNTKPETRDGVAVDSHQGTDQKSIEGSALEVFIQLHIAKLFEDIVPGMQFVHDGVTGFESLPAGMFARWPYASVLEDRSYGLNARAHNEPEFSPLTLDGFLKPPGAKY